MILTFSIGQGVLTLDNELVARGVYSGAQPFVNSISHAVDTVEMAGKGPIPPGLYYIDKAVNHLRLGPIAIPLRSVTKMLRGGFYIHGDNRLLNHTASHGCIIAPHEARVLISISGVNLLKVT